MSSKEEIERSDTFILDAAFRAGQALVGRHDCFREHLLAVTEPEEDLVLLAAAVGEAFVKGIKVGIGTRKVA